MSPREALNIMQEITQQVSATPAVHSRINLAVAVLIGIVEENEKHLATFDPKDTTLSENDSEVTADADATDTSN